jgi:kumamolisin
LQAVFYKDHKAAFNDITTGSDGLPAKSGWDQATGCGSINGPGIAAALAGSGAKS